MTEAELLLLGVLLGAVPTAMLGQIAAAAIAKKLGVKPNEIKQYQAAADGESDPEDTE